MSRHAYRAGRSVASVASRALFLATLSGRGRVWLQSLPFSRLADRVIENAPRLGGRARGEGN